MRDACSSWWVAISRNQLSRSILLSLAVVLILVKTVLRRIREDQFTEFLIISSDDCNVV